MTAEEFWMYYLVFALLISALVGKIATKMNRSPVAWFLASFLINPLIAGLVLAIIGRGAPKSKGGEGAADLSNLSDEDVAAMQAHRARQQAEALARRSLPQKLDQ